ncbi:MAG: hypothetical protein AVDCRST_MAG51-3223 [uncultured Ramlibacter sp.]|uniref:Uncharacterized protein n=1 Tax=uncultured Ramlibacter sp. TaxID=260755 RepID=A0A6J4QDG1_9BURK|nr:MAG: hypothetical protein AVDCRST_MAG51-3223 [uncultured Ramlibacter sp.]
MQTHEVLEQIPAVAEAMQKARSTGSARWKVAAREPGHDEAAEVPVANYAQARSLALALSEVGFRITVLDEEGRVRLNLWPPHLI